MVKKKKIVKKESIDSVKEKIDNRKDKISTKILIGLTVTIMFGLLVYGVKQIFECGFTECLLGGAGAGSVLATIVALIINSLKP